MRNLRQRFGAVVLAGAMAAVMFGSVSPAYAGAVATDGTLGATGKSACGIVKGIMMKVPEGVPGATIIVDALGTLATLWECSF